MIKSDDAPILLPDRSIEMIEKDIDIQTLPKKSFWQQKRTLIAFVIMVALLGVIFIASDWQEILRTIREADWKPLPIAVLATFVSYFGVSHSFARVCKLFAIPTGLRELTEIGFISITLNHVVTTGGVAGYSIRYAMMRRYGAKGEDIFAASILHFYLASLVMLGMLPAGVIYLILNADISQGLTIGLSLLSTLLILVFAVGTGLIFSPALRGPLIKGISKLVRRVTRKDIKAFLTRFDRAMISGVDAMRNRAGTLILIMALLVMDWTSSAIALWFCIDAFGPRVSPGTLLAGFTIGIMAGLMSMIPGGLGAQEGSMAGILSFLGTSFEQAVLASILFRIIYTMLPYMISLIFYGPLLHHAEEKYAPSISDVKGARHDAEPWASLDD
jgi:uncharacterized protein (TIRG00374 family)